MNRGQYADPVSTAVQRGRHQMVTPYSRIRFGYASAEQEGASDPQLLLDGFLQQETFVGQALEGDRYLFLGYKGSGKTAVGEHLRLLAQQRSDLFVTLVYLGDFPYSNFKDIVRGDAEPEAKYPTAWSWLLLLLLLGSIDQDNGAMNTLDGDLDAALRALRSLGLVPVPSLKQVVLATSKRSFKFSIPHVFEAQFERQSTEQGLQIPFLVERLRTLMQR